MEKVLLKDIENQSKELMNKYNLYHNYVHISHTRLNDLYLNVPPKTIEYPEEWKVSKLYNPFYVHKRRKQIAKSVARNILKGVYTPEKPIPREIVKPSGGKRKISIYQIQDSAVSDRFYHNLLSKNKHRFSSLSYAYRNDRNIHFAIQDISNELNSVPRIFVAEFDFSNFFGSIPHSYIFRQLKSNSFLISQTDMQIIKAFLESYTDEGIGIPLGTSISLFLANVVCWKLDRNLENEGLRFARYADDTVIWSKNYNKISRAFEIINEFSEESGININYSKSEGISLLQNNHMPSEFINNKESVEFLGYEIFTDKISMKRASINKVKQQISFLLYQNLIQPIKVSNVHSRNMPKGGLDKNFLAAIMQIRRYLYGNLTEITLKKYLNGTYSHLSFKGIMSFYPLINDVYQLKELDKWLISTILNCLRLRKKILTELFAQFDADQYPFNCSKSSLLIRSKQIKIGGKKGLLEIPSFLRIFRAMEKGLLNDGIVSVMHPRSGYYE